MRLQTKQQFYDARQAALAQLEHGYTSYGVMADGGCLCLGCLRREGRLIVGHTFSDDYDDDPEWTILAIVNHWEGDDLYCDNCGGIIEPTYEG